MTEDWKEVEEDHLVDSAVTDAYEGVSDVNNEAVWTSVDAKTHNVFVKLRISPRTIRRGELSPTSLALLGPVWL